MQNSLDTAQIGNTGLDVTRLGLGGAPLSALLFDVDEREAVATIKRGFELGVRYFDTAPYYGFGRSERRYSHALAEMHRDDFVISTKVGRVLDPADPNAPDDGFVPHELDAVFDFSRDGVLRSLEESLKRLHLDSIDIAFIHDPDRHYEQARDEAFPTLAELRSQGVVGAIGVGMNQWQMLAQFARECDLDCMLMAGRYTLIDRSALPELLPLCEDRGISVVLGGPYNRGVLASDLSNQTYDYTSPNAGNIPLPAEMLKLARRIKTVCDRHAVPLKAAALQFGLAHPAMAATIPGAVTPSEVEENVQMVAYPIPADLWAELKHEDLIPVDAPVPRP
jgi:D-threo-aldose 1-dehydrogenase